MSSFRPLELDLGEGVQLRRLQPPSPSSDSGQGHQRRPDPGLKKEPSIGEISVVTSSSSRTINPYGKPKFFKSRRVLDKTAIQKPWMYKRRDPREKWQTLIPLFGLFLGFTLAGFLVWSGYRGVSRNLYCPVIMDDFANGLDPDVWSKESEVGGYGVGSFAQTTTTDENVFIANSVLVLKPTLQDPTLILNNTLLDLRHSDCTGRFFHDCVAATNTTNGTIVPPVRSGRVNTRRGATIKYGRVEVTARLPSGDWLWPSIVLLPANNTYGEWPQSGEIDILQSRGNNYTYGQGGNDIVASCLHFGPNEELDGWWRNNKKSKAYRGTFSDRFHKFGVEWTEKYIFTYIDTRLLQVHYQNFDKPFWEFGQFPSADVNGTRFTNPWELGTHATPFDQEFYLVLTLHVGGTNGWFADNRAGKPWLDADENARLRFWNAQGDWLHSWDQGRPWMEVSSVKMWQLAPWKGCDGDKASRFVG